MLDIEAMKSTLGTALGNSKADYLKVIEQALVDAYVIVAEEHDLEWLQSKDLVDLLLTQNVSEYTIASDLVGKIVAIEDSTGIPVLAEKTPKEFRDIIRGLTALSRSTPAYFTDNGFDAGKKRIRIYPVPVQSQTLKVRFLEVPRLSNFPRCPAIFAKCLYHGAKSIIAPPQELTDANGRLRWRAVTKDEDMLFKEWMSWAKFKLREKPEIYPSFQGDRQLMDEIEGANNLP